MLAAVVCIVSCTDIHRQSKKQDTKRLPITSDVNRFSNSFAGRLSGKFATKYFKYHTLNMSLHYLVKYLCSKIAMLKK